jgi:hypothetical protein
MDADGAARRSAKYVYGVIRSQAPVRFGTSTIGGSPADVVTVHHGDLATVVSDIATTRILPTRDNILAHEEVNELVMRRYTPIPASFGTLVDSSDQLVDLLRNHSVVFDRVLDDLDAKVQYTVKAIWKRDDVIESIEAADPKLKRIAATGRTGPVSAREAARRRYVKVLRSRERRRISELTHQVLAAVDDVVVAKRINRPLGDAVLLNAAFLVSRDREKDFVRRLCDFGARIDEVTLRYGGPWPPYDFVTIPVSLELPG